VRSTTVATAAVLALIGTAQPARSDDPAAPATPRPWRVLGGASFASARFATPYASRYSPPLTGFPHQSSATQTLPLDASTGHGLQVSVERTLGAHLALQLLGEYATSDVTGEPGLAAGDPREEIVTAGVLALTEDWSLLGNLRYDLETSQTITDGVGLRYQDDCFLLDVTYQRSFIQDQDIAPDQRFLVNFALKYLGTYQVATDAGSVFGTGGSDSNN